MKYCITGGHHNSALVIARALQNKGHKVFWIGHKFAQYGDTNPSAEYLEVKDAGIDFYDLRAGKIASNNTLKSMLKIPFGAYQAWRILLTEKPDVIVSFGSYLGAAVAAAAWLKQLPVFIHEQTSIAGKANLFAAKFAKKIFVTWPSSTKFFPSHKTELTGLPLRPSMLNPVTRKLFKNNKPTILILGGKQGSHIINSTVFDSLPELLKKYNVVHQTGTSSVTQDYEQAISTHDNMSSEMAESYNPQGYISEYEIGKYINNSQVVVSRSGAHIIYELALLGKRAVLIPFEMTYQKEQLKNSQLLTSNNHAIVLRQSNLSPRTLMRAIKSASSLKPTRLKVKTKATENILRILETLQ